jgi:hypothetical protein
MIVLISCNLSTAVDIQFIYNPDPRWTLIGGQADSAQFVQLGGYALGLGRVFYLHFRNHDTAKNRTGRTEHPGGNDSRMIE